MITRFGIIIAFVVAAAGACTSTDSFTNLNPDGPPEIAQVRIKESYMDSTMNLLQRSMALFQNPPPKFDPVWHLKAKTA